jgi:hypothetical protein
MDIAIDVRFDLTVPRAITMILGWIRSGEGSGVFLGTPCNTWSRARRGPPTGGFPQGLRDRDHIWGFGALEGKAFRSLQIGNSTPYTVVRLLIDACCKHRVPVGLENPSRSMLFQCPLVPRLMNARCVA